MSRAPAAGAAVVGIFGPTASGKSAVAEAVAERLPAEIVSADSTQVYRGVPLLTNQSPAHLVAIWGLDREGSVAEYQRLAHEAIDAIVGGGKTALVVGGTGLYFRAAIGGLDLPPRVEPEARERWAEEYDRLGAAGAHALLAAHDPGAAAAVHPNDKRRVVRALELAEAGASLRPAAGRLWADEARLPTLLVGLDLPAPVLEERIGRRTREQFDAGIVEEAKWAAQQPLSSTARKIMGLEALASLPRGEAEAFFVQANRRLAAYQRKWMRRIPGLVSVDGTRPIGAIADEIVALARSRQRVPAGRAR